MEGEDYFTISDQLGNDPNYDPSATVVKEGEESMVAVVTEVCDHLLFV